MTLVYDMLNGELDGKNKVVQPQGCTYILVHIINLKSAIRWHKDRLNRTQISPQHLAIRVFVCKINGLYRLRQHSHRHLTIVAHPNTSSRSQIQSSSNILPNRRLIQLITKRIQKSLML